MKGAAMIESALLSQLAALESGVLNGHDMSFDSVSIDTRTLGKGDLFIAIRGDSFDGHDYINQAEDGGCCGVVVEKSLNSSIPSVQLRNATHALGTIAGINRTAFKGTVFGLTGSTGKTTTKNMLATILELKAPTCATAGNFNNEIGVPLTLLNISERHRFAVIEMGARNIGDIEYLGQFVKPDVAILLNAGVAHIDVFGSYENIVSGKGEIFNALGDQGIAVVNADDPAAELWVKQLQDKTIYSFALSALSFSGKAANTLRKVKHKIWAENIVCRAESSEYTLHFNDQTQEVNLTAPGMHNIANSLAAAAASLAVGVPLKIIAQGLSNLKSFRGRLETTKLKHDLHLIDDSYNANPQSMIAALNVLSLYGGHTVAVLGEMAELGGLSEQLHCELAEYAASTKIDAFYFVGAYAESMKKIVGTRAQCFESNALLGNQLSKELMSGEIVLVKGSRSAAMDEIVELMKRRAQ
ncbi:MAG: UDP-N-acetylmuramoyl-tripeptide--D-alanyl-D-alanine ligase [Oleiphilaceae bacterium]|jgi:UDP-N-acetylmuramoyl-tripeptide--D-alanyl-D-alanine ligase